VTSDVQERTSEEKKSEESKYLQVLSKWYDVRVRE